jgi:hypothetical protein
VTVETTMSRRRLLIGTILCACGGSLAMLMILWIALGGGDTHDPLASIAAESFTVGGAVFFTGFTAAAAIVWLTSSFGGGLVGGTLAAIAVTLVVRPPHGWALETGVAWAFFLFVAVVVLSACVLGSLAGAALARGLLAEPSSEAPAGTDGTPGPDRV